MKEDSCHIFFVAYSLHFKIVDPNYESNKPSVADNGSIHAACNGKLFSRRPFLYDPGVKCSKCVYGPSSCGGRSRRAELRLERGEVARMVSVERVESGGRWLAGRSRAAA